MQGFGIIGLRSPSAADPGDGLSRTFAAADVIDADVMADQTEQDYDSGAWSIPFMARQAALSHHAAKQ